MYLTTAAFMAFASIVKATDLTMYPNTGCMSNPSNWFATTWSCTNLAASTCCRFATGAASVKWTLPASSRGFASDTNSCVRGPWNPVFGPRDEECFDYTNPSINSAWWLTGFSRKRDAPSGDCVAPDVVSYSNGTARISAKIPEDQFDIVKEWMEAKDFEKLDGLESVSEA